MSRFKSVDALQKMLAAEVFQETQDAKKAAGRALGVLVELITFYMIRDWGLENSLAIERGLPEYGNEDITHNVEFSLHPAGLTQEISILNTSKTVSATQICKACIKNGIEINGVTKKSNSLIKGEQLRHACIFAEEETAFFTASMVGAAETMRVTKLEKSPYAMFECKRVGIEEGQKKGPQTIEKAKQGAYVARTVSGLQRVAKRDGSVAAVFENSNGEIVSYDSYYTFLNEAIEQGDMEKLADIVLTVGIVSNHGNWFTAETQNKEMRVLAQSYDWLLFLTDDGLAEFIEEVLHGTQDELKATRFAFQKSFGKQESKTKFTKVTLNAAADAELTEYFRKEQPWERWFNVIAPAPGENKKARELAVENKTVNELEKAGQKISIYELKEALEKLRQLHQK